MSKRTPGGWHAGTAGQRKYVFDDNGKAIVQSCEARNVPIIAAAPRLYALISCALPVGTDGRENPNYLNPLSDEWAEMAKNLLGEVLKGD